MRTFISSDNYLKIKNKIGQFGALEEAFDAARNALIALENNDGFTAGRLTVEGLISITFLCSYYGFKECEEFAGNKTIDADQALDSCMQLTKFGEELWDQ